MQSRRTFPSLTGDRTDGISINPSEGKLTRHVQAAKKLFADTSLVAIVALLSSLLSIALIILLPILSQTRTNAVNDVSLKAITDNQKAMAEGFAAVTMQLNGLKESYRTTEENRRRDSEEFRAARQSLEGQVNALRDRVETQLLQGGKLEAKLAALEGRLQGRGDRDIKE